MTGRDLVTHFARFCGALRGAEVRLSLSDEIDGAGALGLVDIGDRAEIRRALRIALKIQPHDRAEYNVLFARWWTDDTAELPGAGRRSAPPTPYGRTVRQPADAVRRVREMGDEGDGADAADGDEIGYSPAALLRRKPFEEWSEADLRRMDEIMARLAVRLATRRSRRLVPTRGKGLVDMRRSLRRTLATGGELLSFARRARPIERARLVLLCDTSGSMDPHTKFLLAFVLSLGKVIRRANLFVFNTALTRINPWLSRRAVHRTLERLATAVPDWSGGTRMGECFGEFVDRYLPSVVDSKTVVVILSDGLDRGDPAVLAGAMRRIQRAARSVVWLNPLLGDPRYEPKARGIEAALPFVDHFAAAHNIESLERVVPHLAT